MNCRPFCRRPANSVLRVAERLQPLAILRRLGQQLLLPLAGFLVVVEPFFGRIELFDDAAGAEEGQSQLVLHRWIVGPLLQETLVVVQRFLQQLFAQPLHARLIEQRVFTHFGEQLIDARGLRESPPRPGGSIFFIPFSCKLCIR